MTLSRWKIMAVGLGVSLGGLAAMAGQCPKDDPSKGRTAEAPPAVDVPLIPATSASSAPKASASPAPALPDLPPPPASDEAIPVVPPAPPAPAGAPGALPSLPAPAAEPVKKPETPVSSPATATALPPVAVELPKPTSTAPDAVPPSPPSAPPAVEKPSRPMPTEPSTPAGITYTKPSPPAVEPPPPSLPSSPTTGNASSPAMPPVANGPGDVLPAGRTAPASGIGAAGALPLNAAKFRILLRVGEGEPSFEVRSGDDLVLKVVCEKVDIASPEKGSGQSMVKASGKVRFAGFGAEGICEELSFLAGTGEVKMAGDVNIKVKDKLGRVESEFSTASVKYKLDPNTTVGPR